MEVILHGCNLYKACNVCLNGQMNVAGLINYYLEPVKYQFTRIYLSVGWFFC